MTLGRRRGWRRNPPARSVSGTLPRPGAARGRTTAWRREVAPLRGVQSAATWGEARRNAPSGPWHYGVTFITPRIMIQCPGKVQT